MEQGLLYDFYGELLTEHQRNVYEDFVFHNLSLSELAGEYEISRQGIHDLIKRCDRILREYEEKLHLISRFLKIKEKVKGFQVLAEESSSDQEELLRRVKLLSEEILAEL